MAAETFQLTIHMVSSLDGFIAKKDNSISWFEVADHYGQGVTAENPEAFLKTIDCYIMGYNTYEHGIELSKSYGWPYGDTPTIVFTHRDLTSEKDNIEFYSGDPDVLVEQLKLKYNNVWLVGGALLVKDFIRLKLANQIRLSVLPILLGDGKPFFEKTEQEQELHLKSVTAYKTGMVELCYEIKK